MRPIVERKGISNIGSCNGSSAEIRTSIGATHQ